jgi:predicted ATPase
MAKRFVMTGAMGSGKSTVLRLLQAEGLSIIEEPARQILAEQRSIGDKGVPEKNSKLFIQLLLSRAIYQHKQATLDENVIYDRGVPDIIAYAQLFNLDYPPAHQAAKLYTYEKNVFVFPSWEYIYANDDERTMSFEAAKNFGLAVQKIYKEYGYTLIDVPCVSPEERARFIIERLK